MKEILSHVRRCIEDYDMIHSGDCVAVAVSGGKDSLVLLAALNRLRYFFSIPFSLEAITLDLGLPGMDFSPIANWCKNYGIPYTLKKTEIAHIVFDIRQEKNPCSMCAKMRRGSLTNLMMERGLSKVALGHHFDDAVETFYLSLFYEGRLSCFQPVTYLDRSGITQIRPLLYCGEGHIRTVAQREGLPVVPNSCPADTKTKRQEIKDLLAFLSKDYPRIKDYTFGAMQRLPLPEWAPNFNRDKE